MTSLHDSGRLTAIRRAAVSARVSTTEQTTENQLLELRRYVEARGWTATEFVDHGVSGSKDRRTSNSRRFREAERRKRRIA